jgi:hypothetical protein
MRLGGRESYELAAYSTVQVEIEGLALPLVFSSPGTCSTAVGSLVTASTSNVL